jgi:hypothetical protein
MKLRILIINMFLMLGTLVGCSLIGSSQPPPSTQKPPSYPKAQEVQVQTVKGIKGIPAEQTTFTTTDSFESVKDFYKQSLLSDGWAETNYQPSPNGLHFHWIEGCPVYGLDLTLETDDKGQTVVKLKLQREDCI